MVMRANTSFTLATVDGLKSVPLSQYPAEAWRNVFGGDVGGLEGNRRQKYKLYEAVPWLYRGVNTIVEAIVGLPRNEADLEKADLRVEWNNFLNEIVGDYLFEGAMFCIIESNAFGKNRELRRLHPRTMELDLDDISGALIGFKRRLNQAQPIPFARDELGYKWIPSRDSEVSIGTPPVHAALAAAGLLFNIDVYGAKYFQSGAINPTLIEFEDWQRTPPAEQERTKNILRRMFQSGLNKAHEVFPIASNAKVHTLGNPMSELAVPELTDKKREDISTALGIPQSLLFSQAANYATARQDDQHFYDKTIIPLARKIEGMINPYLMTMGINVQLEFREQEMELYQKDEASRSDSLGNLVNVGIPLITALEVLGYDLTDEQWQAVEQAVAEKDEQNDVIQEPASLPIVSTDAEDDEDIQVRSWRPVETIVSHLDKWKAKATKSFRNKGTADVDFASSLIPPTLAAAIAGHLQVVEHREDIGVVFEHAVRLTDHHAGSGVY